MVFSPSGAVLAASAQQIHTQAHQVHAAPLLPNVTCSGNGCTGLDPSATGCSASASTLLSKGIFNGSGQQIGTINLRFSSVCQTNWAQLLSSIGTVQMNTHVERASGADGPFVEECEPTPCKNTLPLNTVGATGVFTDMVWARDVPAEAAGVIVIGSSDFSGCVTQSQSALPC